MAEDTPQEDKTEEPTARKLEKAREDGQVLRSQDLTTAIVTIGFIATLYFAASVVGPAFVDIFANSFIFERHQAFEGFVDEPVQLDRNSIHQQRPKRKNVDF